MKSLSRLFILLCLFALHAAGTSAPSAFVLAYSSYTSSALSASDQSGNIYVQGWAGPPAAPLVNAIQSTPANIYIAKLDPYGKQTLFATYLGGQGDSLTAMAADNAGNLYIAGVSTSGSFPVTTGAFRGAMPAAGQKLIFLAKIDTSAGKLVYSAILGANSLPQPLALAVDASGNAILAGATTGPGIVTTTGSLQPMATGANSTSFITKLNSTGTGLVFSTYLGGPSTSKVSAIALDSSGAVYATGAATTTGFPTTTNAYQPVYTSPGNGGGDCFVSKLAVDGSSLVYSTFLGGKNPTSCGAIALDVAGNAYVAGSTSASDFPVTAAAFQTQFKGQGCHISPSQCAVNTAVSSNLFVSKLNASGSALLYSTFLGGGGGDSLADMAVDSAGNVYLTGTTGSTDFPQSNPIDAGYDCSFCFSLSIPNDAFVSVLDPTLSTLAFSTLVGGPGGDSAFSLVSDATGGVWIGGSASADFPMTPDAANPGPLTILFLGQGTGPSSNYLSHLIPAPAPATPPHISGTSPNVLLNGASIQTITVFGSGFTPYSVLIVNGAARPTTVVSSTELTAAFSNADIIPGTAVLNVQTRTPAGYIAGVSYTYDFAESFSGEKLMQIDIDVHDPAGNSMPYTVGLSLIGTVYSTQGPYAVSGNGPLSLVLPVFQATNDYSISAPGFQTANVTMGLFAGQESSLSVTLVPQGTGHVSNLQAGASLDSGIDLKAGQTLILYVQGSVFGGQAADGVLGCVSDANSKLPHGGTCGIFAARVGNGSWFATGPSFAGPVAAAGRLFLGINEGASTTTQTPFNVTVIVLDVAICSAEPSITRMLDPGFYITEVRTASGTRAGYWGVGVSTPLVSGGFNLGGSLEEDQGSPGFGAVYLPAADTVHVKVGAQPLPAAAVGSAFGLQVRVLDANHNPLGSPVTGGTSAEFDQQLNPGFYVFEVRSAAGSPRATFQMELSNSAGFAGGVNAGGFLVPGLVGFGAFYLPSAQSASIVTYSLPHYDNVGASCVTLTLLDANRKVVATAP
jgi:hypothetical protein